MGSVAAHPSCEVNEASRARRLLPALIAVPSGSRVQSVLDPVGPGAAAIEQLWWLFFWVCTVVFIVVMAALAVALLRGRARRSRGDEPVARPASESEHRLQVTVTAAVLVTAAIVFALTILSYRTDRASAALATHEDKLDIEVTGRQWWWEARYTDQNPSRIFTTANEIHIPVGRTVQVRLFASDVIHSFWVPNLQGKRDLIPGQVNYLYLRADEPGVYRGQCAEFCGYQHAKMAFVVVAEPEDAFTVWRDAQIAPAAEPDTDEERQGHDVFVKGPCVMCHAIRGTSAGGRTGPDLTHLASRKTIAAGTLPNTRGHLAAWISDPQGIKPGSKMPSMGLPPPDLQALLSYLESLR